MAFDEDIAKAAKANEYFRKVLATGKFSQVVVMALKPGEDIGEEVHDDVDQVLVCVEGEGESVLEGTRAPFGVNRLVQVPAGTKHNFVNSGKGPMKLFTVYAPPQHEPGTIHKTKAEAEASEEHYKG
jgi:mannose-6-phosphate isomerase-like protein (cupin superfamily)